MPKGIPKAGKRAPGGGGKREGAGRPPSSERKQRNLRMTDEEYEQVKTFLQAIRKAKE